MSAAVVSRKGKRPSQNRREAVARLAAGLSTTLIGIPTVAVALVALPPNFGVPEWYLSLDLALISNGALALLGLLALHLAVFLDPSRKRLQLRLERFRQLAALAAAGYLLLVPVQCAATFNTVTALMNQRNRTVALTQARIERYREALRTARSPEDLQQRLRAVDGPTIPAQLAGLPLDRLRAELQQQLRGSAAAFEQNSARSLDQPLRSLLKQSARVILTALLLAFGFASGAQLPGADRSLLEQLRPALGLPFLRRGRRNRRSRRRRSRDSSSSGSGSGGGGNSSPAADTATGPVDSV